jgi:ketosteroid isomerase-like protein
MSEENVALLRRAVEAYNHRDIPALLVELDPEVKWHPALPGLLSKGVHVYSGHDGIIRMFRDFFEVLDEIHFEYWDVRDNGDRVVAIGQLRIRGKASGAETVAPYANLAEVRNGKGIRITGYLEPAEALEDLKLAEMEGGGPHRATRSSSVSGGAA